MTLDYASPQLGSRIEWQQQAVPAAILMLTGFVYLLAFICVPIFVDVCRDFKVDLPSLTQLTFDSAEIFRRFLSPVAWLLPVGWSIWRVRRPHESSNADIVLLLLTLGAMGIICVLVLLACSAPFVNILQSVSSPK